MNLRTKFDLSKLRIALTKHKPLVAAGGVILVLGAIYLASKHEDSKVVYQDVEHPDFTGGKILSAGSDIYQKKERVLSDKLDEMEKKIETLTEELSHQRTSIDALGGGAQVQGVPELAPEVQRDEPLQATLPQSPVTYSPSQGAYSVSRVEAVAPAPQGGYGMPAQALPAQAMPAPIPFPPLTGPDIISFPSKTKGENVVMSVKLPSGSFVKAKLLTGVEAPEGKALPVLLQADYAFVGPNKSKIDLSGCFLIAKSTGNLSIERVEMQASKISCVAKSGRMFEREINGFITDDKDNSFAVMGPVNSKQDRVATMAFLASVVQGISSAIGQAQTVTQSNATGGTSSMITGDQQKYIAAGGASNAASVVTQWYLNHAQSLLPTINVGSGQDVWIVMQESVELPNWYFKKLEDRPGDFSFLSKLTE